MGLQVCKPSSPSTFPYHKSVDTLHLANFFQLRGFVGLSPHPPSSVISTLHPKFCDLHFYHHIYRKYRAPKYFIPSACKSDRPPFYTSHIFSIIHNCGFADSRVGEFMKSSIFKFSLVHPRHSLTFPNIH
jgi:hypothetical protein